MSTALPMGGRPKIVVGTGWWSDRVPHAWALGSRTTRAPAFFEIWHALVERYLQPHRIVVTDSHSPLKPEHRGRPGVVWVELDRNYGHANDIRVGRIHTRHSGFMRSVFLGATFALACDADYYVYVEQDCVIHGEGFLDAITSRIEHPIAVGARTTGGVGISGPAAPMLQQSLLVVRKDGLERFVASILLAPETDGELPPEVKFERDLQPFSVIPIPFGRSRPLDFAAPHFYAQHLTEAELAAFLSFESPPVQARGPAALAGGRGGTLDALCVEYPVLREVRLAWERRQDLRASFPEANEGDLDRVLGWALRDGVNEDPVLAELASEIAALWDRSRDLHLTRTSHRLPEKVHVVSLATFPRSFVNCARALHQALERAAVPTAFHESVDGAELDAFGRMPGDEIVHVVGQEPVGRLLHSPARNWVLTIHGAAPYVLPLELHGPPGAALEELRAYIERVPHVICSTFAAKREIAAAYGLAHDLIDPIPYFFDADVFRPDGPRYPAPGRYFLVVSTYHPKKNYVAVLEALHLLASATGDACPFLALAGTITPPLLTLVEDSVARWPSLKGRLLLLGHVEDLATLYRGALAVVSMSHHEGFGLPYIEAALCGTPVIGPKQSARAAAWAAQPTRELLGGAAILVDPNDPHELATMMRTLAADDAWRATVAQRCHARAVRYVEPAFLLSRYLHVYGKVLARAADA